MIRLAQLRHEHNMSQEELAVYLNISQQTISKYENGKLEPDMEAMGKLAKLFDVSVDYLMGFSEIRKADLFVGEEAEVYQVLDDLRKRPEMKMLFKVSKNATKEEIEKLVQMIETFKKQSER